MVTNALEYLKNYLKHYYDGKDKQVKRRNFSHLFQKNLDPPYNFEFEEDVWSEFYNILLNIKSFKNLNLNNFLKTNNPP